MEIIKSEIVRGRTNVILVRGEDGGLRILYEFLDDDAGYFHDGGSTKTIFGVGTRLNSVEDAEIAPPEYAGIRYRQALATV